MAQWREGLFAVLRGRNDPPSERRAGLDGKNDVDAALFTSYHCINYYSGWLYCYFGRKYGMVIDHNKATTISAGIDGGQPGGAASATTSPIPTGAGTISIRQCAS